MSVPTEQDQEYQLELIIPTPQVRLQVTPCVKNPHITYDRIQNIYEFTEAHYKHIWVNSNRSHQKENLHKIERFCEFSDYAARPITSYRPTHIFDFLEHRKSVFNNKNGTLNRYISALSKVFKHYDDEYNTRITPRIKWRKEDGNRPRVFSDTEVSKLQDVLSNSEYPWAAHLVTIALKTGMRKGEILSIGLGRHDVLRYQVHGDISENKESIHLKSTKNGSDRVVQLHPDAIKSLAALEWKPSISFDHHQFYRVWALARRKIAPNDETFVFHVCRHTAATKLASLNFNTKQIAGVLGHKTILTTAKYIHDDIVTQKAMMNSL